MKPYYKYSTYLKDRFGVRVNKVSVDAGFSCPNKDGKISRQGCIYCDNRTFNFYNRNDKIPTLEDQISLGIDAAKKHFKAKKFIIYFQSNTNTYASLEKLKKIYDTVNKFKDVVGISIGTRPDCVNKDILDLISSYTDKYEVWIEYGLQSIHNNTLKFINRGHTYEDFLKTIELTRKYPIKVCVHVILDLPGETEEMMLETAKEMARLKIDGIKIHPLYIVKGTKLEEIYNESEYEPMQLKEYIKLLSKFLSIIPFETVIQRISAYSPKDLLIAPDWVSKRNTVESVFSSIF